MNNNGVRLDTPLYPICSTLVCISCTSTKSDVLSKKKNEIRVLVRHGVRDDMGHSETEAQTEEKMKSFRTEGHFSVAEKKGTRSYL